MSLQSVSAEAFRDEVRKRHPDLEDEFTGVDPLGGTSVYLSDGRAFLHLALRKEEKILCVVGVLGGGGSWMHELRKIAVFFGYDWIAFRVRRGRWGTALTKYWKAQKVLSDEEGEEYFVSPLAR